MEGIRYYQQPTELTPRALEQAVDAMPTADPLAESSQPRSWESGHEIDLQLTVDTEMSVTDEPDSGAEPDSASPSVDVKHHGYRSDSSPEEVALLRRAQADDREAFADLYRMHVGRVTRYVAARMRDRDRSVVPDLVQDTFCEAFAELPAAHTDIRGWFLAHAARACLHHDWSNRRYIRAAKTMQEQSLIQPAEALVQTETLGTLGHIAVVQALSRLAADERHALQLRFLDGLPPTLRASTLDRSYHSLKKLEARAIRNLRAVFFETDESVAGSSEPRSVGMSPAAQMLA